jgi:hypothetical protein
MWFIRWFCRSAGTWMGSVRSTVANLTVFLPSCNKPRKLGQTLPNRHLEIAEMRDKSCLFQSRPSEEHCPCGKHPPLCSVAV